MANQIENVECDKCGQKWSGIYNFYKVEVATSFDPTPNDFILCGTCVHYADKHYKLLSAIKLKTKDDVSIIKQ